MSSSQHPVALRLERRVGGATRLLATVMLLPLVDGIFAALVLSGGLDSVVGIVQIGLLVFGGSATLAVVIAEMERDMRAQIASVLLVGVPLVALAAVEAAVAPTIESVLDIVIFERFAAVVIIAIAAKTASATIGEYLPRPSIIVALGLIASVEPAGAALTVTPDLELMARAAAAGLVGVGFALALVILRPHIEGLVDIDRFRFGTAIALGTLAFSVIGFIPSNAPLPVFIVAGLLAFDPAATPGDDPDGDLDSSPPDQSVSSDGGNDDYEGHSVESEHSLGQGYDSPVDDPKDDRAPWM
ncbi:DUF5794 domain-containing protein [Halanaeroarchaeum sulfurireducens]|uniref:Uncharacterized protein n=1 Tax=Halanaeroarchaeum sulfurireducens TaxID=1604004 RepID=A0A0F7PD25_9EURY|nr:DUF5794 domain-containing protein [Halanaeroarchaeum sulfurireducens]AKH98045.1 hypothetical protein HLASF_1566 [Halanaeroarchaeum sulfurireducens]